MQGDNSCYSPSTGSSGGICEKSKLYSDGKRKSLNTGIITVQNYASHVPPKVSHITFAHEVGHNFGSPVSRLLPFKTLTFLLLLFFIFAICGIYCLHPSPNSPRCSLPFVRLLFYSMTLASNAPLESLRCRTTRSRATTSCTPEPHQGTNSTITSSLSAASAILALFWQRREMTVLLVNTLSGKHLFLTECVCERYSSCCCVFVYRVWSAYLWQWTSGRRRRVWLRLQWSV